MKFECKCGVVHEIEENENFTCPECRMNMSARFHPERCEPREHAWSSLNPCIICGEMKPTFMWVDVIGDFLKGYAEKALEGNWRDNMGEPIYSPNMHYSMRHYALMHHDFQKWDIPYGQREEE